MIATLSTIIPCSSSKSKLGSMWRIPLHSHTQYSSSSFSHGLICRRQSFLTVTAQLFSNGSNNNGGVGDAGKGQGNDDSEECPGISHGLVGICINNSSNPSGSGRSNAPSKSSKKPKSLWEQVRLLEEKAPQKVASLKKFRRLEQEKNILLKEKKALEKELNNRPDGLFNEAAVSLKKFRRLEQEKNIIVKEKKALEKKLNNRPDVPILFHGHYKFGPENIQDLSRLISMHLMNKPSEIDSNRIYSCVSKLMSRYLAYKPRGIDSNRIYIFLRGIPLVRACFTDLEYDYHDEPEYYDTDNMRMLLATCLASNWFKGDQLKNIKQWNNDHFG
ncbi:hypothetical protein QTG54_016173 [Skeletonema marinoi]|uniref:Uncharacterized protein n=1 Tax=Skeletonema marinoi TaxID=267567 RepID=A0AAD9D433_9STRA|nr:hypothetical protein QTG54_016173 [Skeletonema marinoi]